jgi:thioredoxin 2
MRARKALIMSDAIVRCPECGRRNRVPAVTGGTPRCGQCHTALPWVVDATDDTFAGIAEGSGVPVLVDFWAPWCGPCRMVSPALEQLAGERAGRIKLVKVNVDESPRLQQRFGVQAIPTLMVLRDGKVLARQAGAAPVAALRGWLDQSLAAPATAG